MPANKMKRVILVAAFLLTITLSGAAYESSPARVTDISDRTYEGAVIKLLDGAKKSIVISMYTMSLGAQKNNPIWLLLNDLVEARGRGVEVTLYLNTKFKGSDDPRGRMSENEVLKKLEAAGCVMHLLAPHRRLHDKLIVVDSRYVVDGSTNWSLSALLDNYESATLIDSPGLAEAKLARLRTFELGEPQKAAPLVHAPIYAENLPSKVNVPALLVTDKRYLPLMVSRSDERAMELYLLLLALKEKTGEDEAFIDLESMALSLGLPRDWDDTALRRQAIKSLKRLENYGLIKATFFHSKDARVRLTEIMSGRFSVNGAILTGRMGAPARFYLIAKAYLASKGENIDAIPDKKLARRFGLYSGTIEVARKELSNKKGYK